MVDDNNTPLSHEKIFYGLMQSSRLDSTETDNSGSFIINELGYFLIIRKKDFFGKSIFIQNPTTNNKIDTIIKLRSRLNNWYSAKQIDSNDVGITFSEAISKYKLDITQCQLAQEPHNFIVGLRAELADSSYIMLYTKYYFDSSLKKKENVLKRKITAIGIEYVSGHQTFFGETSGYGLYNIYYESYLEEQRKNEHQKK